MCWVSSPLFSFYLIPVKFTLTPSNVPFKKFPANHIFSKIYVRCFMQNVNGGFHLIIHSGGVGNQTYAFAFQALEILVLSGLRCLSLFLSFVPAMYHRAHRAGKGECISS